MKNSMKVAKWEIKRNVKNKSFIISLFLTPLLIIGFGFIGSLIGGGSEDDVADADEILLYVHDAIGVYDEIEATATAADLNWTVSQTDITEDEVESELVDSENVAYLFLNEETVSSGSIPVYTSEGMDAFFIHQISTLQGPVLAYQMDQLGLTDEQAAAVMQGVYFEEVNIASGETDGTVVEESGFADDEFIAKLVPAGFAAIILISIVFTGMAIFQSASQEKKEKIAEIILSSLTPGELMQGKIIGYFVLGLIQTAVLMIFLIPYLLYLTDIPFFEYLFVPETILYLALAVLNYLMFAAIFVGIGATMEDISTAGNFQGLVMMLPFLPAIFIGPVLADPSGLMAQIGTYIPFTAPGVLLVRLAMLDVWPWIEIIISLVIIIVSTGLFIRLAGKIFQVGILMYGKNATPGEIWKWIRA
ncbi:ABC transporter permease [Oceanobacillus sp. CAU 1775]